MPRTASILDRQVAGCNANLGLETLITSDGHIMFAHPETVEWWGRAGDEWADLKVRLPKRDGIGDNRIATAIGLIAMNPTLTDAQVARAAGIHQGALSRNETYTRVRDAFRATAPAAIREEADDE